MTQKKMALEHTSFGRGVHYLFDKKREWGGFYKDQQDVLMIYVGRVPAATKNGYSEMFRHAAGGWRETFTEKQLNDYRIMEQKDKEDASPVEAGGARKNQNNEVIISHAVRKSV